MKKITLLLIASLAVLTTGASAASSQTNPDMVVLPTYVVTSPRYLPVEQQINASLKEFSRQASAPMVIAPELGSLKVQSAGRSPLAEASRVPVAGRLAKS